MCNQKEVLSEFIRTLMEMCPGQKLKFEEVHSEYEQKCLRLKRVPIAKNLFSEILCREGLGVKPYKGPKNVTMLKIAIL